MCLVSGHPWCHEDSRFPEGPQLCLGLWVPDGLRIERGKERQKVRKERGTKKAQKRRSKKLTPLLEGQGITQKGKAINKLIRWKMKEEEKQMS